MQNGRTRRFRENGLLLASQLCRHSSPDGNLKCSETLELRRVLGDVGGWGTGSQPEYQWAGMLGYRVNARWGLHAGYRYLDVDKNADRGVVFKATTAGVVLGMVIDLK